MYRQIIEEYSDWIDSPEGELWTEICDALEDLLEALHGLRL
jgi:hypothetical protein